MLCFGTLASRFSPLVLPPCHQSTGSCSSARKACIQLTPPLRRSPSARSSGTWQTFPEGIRAPGFDDIKLLNDASSMGLLSFVFRMHTCSRSCLELFLQRSPPRPFTAAAWSGLRPAPESRSQGPALIFHAALRHRFLSRVALLSSCLCSTPKPRKPKLPPTTEVYDSTFLFIDLDLEIGQLLPEPLLYRRHQPVMSRVGVDQDRQIICKPCILDVGVLAKRVVSFARSSMPSTSVSGDC